MKKLFSIIGLLAMFILFTSETGCESTPGGIQGQEQVSVEENQGQLMTQTPAPQLDKSLERIAIVKRLELFQDENKVSYIYLVSFGKVMAFYTIKGKVTSGAKRLTTNEKIISNYDGSTQYGYSTVESPSLDGTYGSSGDYIFFWTTDGTYVQWNDAYMLCDKPLKLATQPELVMEVQ